MTNPTGSNQPTAAANADLQTEKRRKIAAVGLLGFTGCGLLFILLVIVGIIALVIWFVSAWSSCGTCL